MKFPLRRRPRDLDCIEFVELVTDYLEGALPAAERRALEHHLGECDDCTAYLQQTRGTQRMTGALRADDLPIEGLDELLVAFRAYQAREAPTY